MSTIAVFVALGGTSYAVARNSIGTPQLKDGAVTSAKVKNGSLQRRDLSSQASSNGPRGPRGADGPAGAPGASGTPGANATIESWKPLDLGIEWDDHPNPEHPPASYRKDSFGIVYLRGVVTNAAGTPLVNDIIGTLPTGYRPQYRILLDSLTGDSTTAGRLNIQTNGQITWSGGATDETDFTSLNDVGFPTDG